MRHYLTQTDYEILQLKPETIFDRTEICIIDDPEQPVYSFNSSTRTWSRVPVDSTSHAAVHTAMDAGNKLSLSTIQTKFAKCPGNVAVDWSKCSIGTPTAGWTVEIANDVTYCGLPTLKITSNNTTTLSCAITLPANLYIGNAKRFSYAIRVGDRAMAGDNSYPVQLRFGYSTGSLHIFQCYAAASCHDGNDWSVGTAYDAEAAGTGHITGTPVWAKVDSEESTTVTLLMAAAAAVTEPIYVSPFFTDEITPPILTIFADGEYIGQYDYLRGAMARAGVRSSLAITVPNVGSSSSYMTLAQLSKMYAAGHEMIRHTGQGTIVGWDDLTKYPDGSEYANVLADSLAFQSWANTNGFTKGIGYGVVGVTNGMVKTQTLARRNNIASALKAAGEIKNRQNTTSVATFDSHFEHAGNDALFTTPVYQLTSSTTTGNIDTLFTKLKERGGWYGIVFHNVVMSGATGNSVNVSMMDYIMDKIATEVAAGTILCLPFSEAMQEIPLNPTFASP